MENVASRTWDLWNSSQIKLFLQFYQLKEQRSTAQGTLKYKW